MFDGAPVGITVIDFDGRWLRVNRELCRMLGYEPEELIGASFSDFTHPDDVAEDRRRSLGWSPASSTVRRGRSVICTRTDQWSGSTSARRWFATRRAEPLYLVSHLQDITERRVAQAQRRESDRRLHAIIDNSPSLVIGQRTPTIGISSSIASFSSGAVYRLTRSWAERAEEMDSGPVFAGERAKDQLGA